MDIDRSRRLSLSHDALDTVVASVAASLEPKPPGKPRRHTLGAAPSSPSAATDAAPPVLRHRAATWSSSSATWSELASDVDHEAEARAAVARASSSSEPPSEELPEPTTLSVALLATGLVVSGLATNVAFELLSKDEEGITSLLTLLQYAVALAGSLPDAWRHLSAPTIPIRVHVAFATLMLATAFCGNLSVEFSLPFPLYLVRQTRAARNRRSRRRRRRHHTTLLLLPPPRP
jgi:hypothetical protein